MTLKEKIKATEEKLNLRYVAEETDEVGWIDYIFRGKWLPEFQMNEQLNIKPKGWAIEFTNDCRLEWLKPLAEIWGSE